MTLQSPSRPDEALKGASSATKNEGSCATGMNSRRKVAWRWRALGRISGQPQRAQRGPHVRLPSPAQRRADPGRGIAAQCRRYRLLHPRESYLPVLDALHDANGIRTIVTRHEGAASNMADAYGKLTGRPGICFVTRGPGATHAANGVHTAQQDSTPMILFVGQVESAFKGREAFQEVDYVQMFSGLAKWAVEIDRIERIPEIVGRAFSVATSGRPGPVVVALPEEILFGSAQVADAPEPRCFRGDRAPRRWRNCANCWRTPGAPAGTWRQRLGQCRQETARRLRRGQWPAGGHLVPSPGPVRQP